MKPFSKLTASPTPRKPHVSEVPLNSSPTTKEVTSALEQLKDGKKLYVRLNKRGDQILTTTAPRWYKFSDKKEQKSAQQLLLRVLLSTNIFNDNDRSMVERCAGTLAFGVRNTDELRTGNQILAKYVAPDRQ